MRFKSVFLQIAAIASAAAIGLVVLVASVGGQEGGSNVKIASTPTRTADETSALSDRLHAEDQARTSAVADEFISARKPTGNLERSEVEALVTEPPNLDAALHLAAALIIGTVEDQFLERADGGAPGLPRARVVSTLRSSNGARSTVSQPAILELGRATGALVLGFLPGEDTLNVGPMYSLLVETDPATGRLSAVRGHIYVVSSAGILSLASSDGSEPGTDDASGHSIEWLSSLFEATKNDVSMQ